MAYRIRLHDPERGLHYVSDLHGGTLGVLLTTSPQTDDIIGYSGPNNLLIALGTNGVVAGVELLRSGDTRKHVELILRDPDFLRSFIGWKPGEGQLKVSGVSGATLTSYAIAESIQTRLAGAAASLRFPEPVTIDDARKLFTNAASLKIEQRRWRVLDSSGTTAGFLARTSPEADNVSGYRGPTEALVGLASDGRTVTGVRLRKSYDTDSYVSQVASDERFMKMFIGKTIDDLAKANFRRERIEGLSGATLTRAAVAEGIKRRFASDLKEKPVESWRPAARDWGVAGVIGGALVMSFSSLRGRKWARILWQAILIGYVGLWSGDLLSLSLFGGWATNGVALKAAPGLVLLAAAAFIFPLVTRRQVYCHQICPHGAAQQWLGALGMRFKRREKSGCRTTCGVVNAKGVETAVLENPPRKRVLALFWLRQAMALVPFILLLTAVTALLFLWPLTLANLEPFDAWSWRAAGWISIAIAVAGLVASLFIPQAYCRYGCPTGALLNFVRSTGSGDRWSSRDWTALILIGAALISTGAVRSRIRPEPEIPSVTLHGRTMGSTWTVKVRDEVADPRALQRWIDEEFEWCEQMTSHWRTNTDLSIFNRKQSTEPIGVPWPVVTLSRWSAEISQLTGGAYDITVGPLVRLWGFGPGPRRSTPPSDAEIAALRSALGWQKLEVRDGELRKKDPALEIDLSAIAKGWAIDQVAEMLPRRGYTNFLVEAGGELRASGIWIIGIEHPTRSCALTNEAIATSGTYRQNFKFEGREYSHLLDARTGRPISHDTVSASVRYKDCGHADAWATAMNVLGADEGAPLAEKLGLAVQFVVKNKNGALEVRSTTAWKEPGPSGKGR